MRLLFILLATLALGQAAVARAPECKLIVNATARLACYDRAAPPAADPAISTPVAQPPSVSNAESTRYVDAVVAEDAVMNERIKGICRGC